MGSLHTFIMAPQPRCSDFITSLEELFYVFRGRHRGRSSRLYVSCLISSALFPRLLCVFYRWQSIYTDFVNPNCKTFAANKLFRFTESSITNSWAQSVNSVRWQVVGNGQFRRWDNLHGAIAWPLLRGYHTVWAETPCGPKLQIKLTLVISVLRC